MWLSIAFVLIGNVTSVLVSVMAAFVANQVSQLTQAPGASQFAPAAPVVSPDQLAPEVTFQTSAQDVTCPEPLPAQLALHLVYGHR